MEWDELALKTADSATFFTHTLNNDKRRKQRTEDGNGQKFIKAAVAARNGAILKCGCKDTVLFRKNAPQRQV